MIFEKIVTHSLPKSPISEAYRVLRTNLQFTGVDTPLQCVVITSSGPSEGKSTTVANLAVTFAHSGSRVLILDADLRKPRIHKMFNLANKTGATNAILDPDNVGEYIQNSIVDGLHILTSGPIPPNPSELLGSIRMKNLITILRGMYDFILIDTPPVCMVTDAQILSTMADGTAIVAASGQVAIEDLNRAKTLLQNVNANILGVILNKKVRDSNAYYYYYYYYESDDKEQGTRKKKRRR